MNFLKENLEEYSFLIINCDNENITQLINNRVELSPLRRYQIFGRISQSLLSHTNNDGEILYCLPTNISVRLLGSGWLHTGLHFWRRHWIDISTILFTCRCYLCTSVVFFRSLHAEKNISLAKLGSRKPTKPTNSSQFLLGYLPLS